MQVPKLEDRIGALERRIARLEHREGWTRHLLDSRNDAFAYFVLENDLTEEQSRGIAEVMESAHMLLEGGRPIDAMEFEKQLLPYIPPKQMPGGSTYSFIQRLLLTFAETGQWYELVKYFKRDWNVPTLKDEQGD